MSDVQLSYISKFNELIYEGKIKLKKTSKCFCGGSNFKTLSKYDRFCLPFGTVICRECGLVTQNISVREDCLQLFYDKIYWPLISGEDPNAIKKKTFKTKLRIKEDNSYILPFLLKIKKKNLKIFEVGSGDGSVILKLNNELKRNGLDTNLYSCDYSKEAVNSCKEKGLTSVIGGADKLKRFGKADVLILSHIVEHYLDLNKVLEDIKNLLKKDGYLYIELPGIKDLVNKKDYLFSYQNYNNIGHIHNFTLTTLRKVMAKGKLELLQGNEYIKAVFKFGNPGDIESGYEEILKALKEANKKEELYFKNRKFINYLKRIIKTILFKRGYL